ncbi:MAG: iron-containing alcohol dehydrogenase [Eggerthellales bacterium]|nr:iron-containing alcohol dehydrogenase [Eggerthellales bacterium]
MNMGYKAFCRTFQAVMKVGNYFLGYRTPEFIEGTGCVTRLPQRILDKGVNKVLLVTDQGLMELGLPGGLIAAMDQAGLEYEIFADIQPNPTDLNVEAGFARYVEASCQGIVAFGGGSPMDAAKAIAAKVAHPRKPVAKLQGILRVHARICPFWAVPTTAGTGSETTVAAVITEAATHHKASINDPSILPRYAVLDPQLTVGLPPFITATTGMDALCHAVESYINWTYCTHVEKKMSKDAVKLIHDNILAAYRDGTDLHARRAMQYAAFYAGRSFTRGCVGYVHAVGHTLGGLYGVPHGLAMSVILPHVLRQFGPAVYDKLADLADACGIGQQVEKLAETPASASNRAKAEAFIMWIDEVNQAMGLPKGFDCIRDEDIPQMIAWAKAEANPLYPVPVIWGDEELRRLIETIRAAA